MCTPERAQKIIQDVLLQRRLDADETTYVSLEEQLIHDAHLAQAEGDEALISLAVPIINTHLLGIIT